MHQIKKNHMPVYNTEKLLDYLSEHTEAFLQKAVSEWQTLPHSVFAHKASPEKWSANQCLAHLNSYGRYYLPLMENRINVAKQNGSHVTATFIAGWLGNYFTKMMLTDASGKPAKKMSAPKEHNPQVQEDSYQVIAEFIEQQEKLLVLLNEAKHIDMNKVRVPISITKFIRLKLGDTFLFLIAHNYRHTMQAMRALNCAKAANKNLKHFTLSDI